MQGLQAGKTTGQVMGGRPPVPRQALRLWQGQGAAQISGSLPQLSAPWGDSETLPSCTDQRSRKPVTVPCLRALHGETVPEAWDMVKITGVGGHFWCSPSQKPLGSAGTATLACREVADAGSAGSLL